MSDASLRTARVTFTPDQLRKLAGPIVPSTLSGLAALLDEARKGGDSRAALDRAVDVASQSLLGLDEADFDTERHLLSLDATVTTGDPGS